MALPKEYADRLKTLVEREPITLPDLEIEIVVRGLTGGEIQRISEHDRGNEVQIALSTEHNGKPIWQANSLEDLNEISELSGLDRMAILELGNRLSGLGKMQAWLKSHRNGNGSSSSHSDSAAPSGNSAKRSPAKR